MERTSVFPNNLQSETACPTCDIREMKWEYSPCESTKYNVMWYFRKFLQYCLGNTLPVCSQQPTHLMALSKCERLGKAPGTICSWSVLYLCHYLSPQNRAFTQTCFGKPAKPLFCCLLFPQHSAFKLLHVSFCPVGTQRIKWLLARVSSLLQTRSFHSAYRMLRSLLCF